MLDSNTSCEFIPWFDFKFQSQHHFLFQGVGLSRVDCSGNARLWHCGMNISMSFSCGFEQSNVGKRLTSALLCINWALWVVLSFAELDWVLCFTLRCVNWLSWATSKFKHWVFVSWATGKHPPVIFDQRIYGCGPQSHHIVLSTKKLSAISK